MFEVVDQVVISKNGDVLGFYLWCRLTTVFVACDTIECGKANTLRGMTSIVV
jgi:hypothetical protein